MTKESDIHNFPLVSVIVTAFNQGATISQTLDSIIVQKCSFGFEIIIGDDFSQDGTREICSKYETDHPGTITTVRHTENRGVAANFVSCMSLAKGKYIAICAADDFWHNPYKLQLQVDYLEYHSECGLLYTDYDKLNIRNGKLHKNHLKLSKKNIYEGKNLISSIFEGRVPILTLTVMFRKELFDRYIPVNDYIKNRFPLEDWPTWIILSKHTGIGYLQVSTGTYRFGHESISNLLTYEKIESRFIKEQIMYKYLCDMFPEELHYNHTGFQCYKNNILLNLAYNLSDFKKAKLYSKRLNEFGYKSMKTTMTNNLVLFYTLAILKKIKNNFYK